jgi:hypothetical protein
MSSEHPEPAPPLQPEDLALAAELSSLSARPPSPGFLDHLLLHLELAVSDAVATSSPESIPMPLDASLLAFEHELRSLRPLEVDFPTGQRVLNALQDEMSPRADTFPVIRGTGPAAPAPAAAPPATRRRWTVAAPWASAAALVAIGWTALPHLPRLGTTPPTVSSAGLIPFAPDSGEKGTVDRVFLVNRPDPGEAIFGGAQSASIYRPASVIIPESPVRYGHLNVVAFDLPDEYCRQAGISHGVGIRELGAGGPAKTHGLEVGDIILRINGAPVGSADELAVMIRNSAPGSVVKFKVLRGRLIGDIAVRLGHAPSA